MSSLISQRRSLTRERLIRAALPVFAEKGVAAASVEEICEAAGFTRGAFYSNFESKDDLCIALLEWQCEQSLADVRSTVDSLVLTDDPPFDVLARRALEMFTASQWSDRAWVLAEAELRLYAAREDSLRAAYREFEDRTLAAFADIIVEALAPRGYRLVLPAVEAIAILAGAYQHGVLESVIRDEDTGERTTDQLVLLLSALVAPAREDA
ncbi:TetR/AcrR family transcriptional regulator [Nigerium massiliense]|uniref:TetR/AcrR family transcriptional regulator n=1 Tax=Nigerium massiliense TaxID=1522317 RepID=UPI0006947F78|nr:TetR/AcrR family transcriptional regulator [Nigerium massiliense]